MAGSHHVSLREMRERQDSQEDCIGQGPHARARARLSLVVHESKIEIGRRYSRFSCKFIQARGFRQIGLHTTFAVLQKRFVTALCDSYSLVVQVRQSNEGSEMPLIRSKLVTASSFDKVGMVLKLRLVIIPMRLQSFDSSTMDSTGQFELRFGICS